MRHALFTEALFKDVLLRDQHVAASFRQTSARPDRLRKIRMAVAALGLLGLLLTIAMTISFFRNRALIDEAEKAGRAVLGHMDAGPNTGEDSAVNALRPQEVNDLETLRQKLVELDEHERSWFQPLFSRFGLYSGGKVAPRMREIYFDFVSQRLLNPSVAALEQSLQSAAPAAAQPSAGGAATNDVELDRYFNKLKVYLMLESRRRAERDELQKQLAEYWKEPEPKTNLAFFAEQASRQDDDDPRIPRLKTRQEVVEGARKKLKGYPPISRVYNQLLSKINERIRQKGEIESVDLKKILEGQGTDIFEAANLHTAPGAFTKEAYYKYVLSDVLSELIAEAEQEDYVTGEKGGQINPIELKNRYFRDYATHWQSFAQGITISREKLATKENAEEMLDRLAAPNSPMISLVERIAYHTNLREPPVTDGVLGWLKGFAASKVPMREIQSVQTAFAPLHTFVQQKDSSVKSYQDALRAFRARLRDIDGDWKEVGAKQRDNQQAVGLKAAEDGVNAALGALKDNPSGRILQRPVLEIRDVVSVGDFAALAQRWTALAQAARVVEAGFPFVNSSSDAPLQNFNDFFNPASGSLKAFLDQARGYFNVDGARWQLKPAHKGKFSDRFVEYINDAMLLQKAVFQGEQPKFDCTITLPPGLDAEISLDGRKIDKDNSSGVFSWPNVSAAKVTNKIGGSPVQYTGPWALYKLFVNGGGAGRKSSYQLSWPRAGVTAKLDVQSSWNPLDMGLFQRLRAPGGLNGQ